MNNRLFHDWVSPRLDVPLLIIMSICIGATSGVSTSISTYVVSSLGTNPADASMCSYAYMAGMTIGFLPVNKLRGYFSSKHMLLGICAALLFLNYVLTQTDSAPIAIMATFMIGAVRLMGSIMMVVNLIPILMPNGSQRFLLYCVYYPLSLMVSPLSGTGMAWIADRLGWHYSFHFCNLLLFIVLVMTLALVHGNHNGRKIPLWKFDWFSLILMAGWMMSFIYVIVYGRNKDWFDSVEIRIASLSSMVLILLLMLRNVLRTAPVMELYVLQYRNVRVGLTIMFLLCTFYSLTGPLTTWTNVAFRNDLLENARVNTYPVLGYLLGAVVGFFYYKWHIQFKEMLLLSVLCYTVSSWMIYSMVGPQTEPSSLFLPMVLRGMAIILSYVTIGLYVVAGVTPKALAVIPVFLIFVRSFLGPVIFGGIYSVFLYYRQIQITDRLAAWSDQTDPLFQMRFKGLNSPNADPLKAYQVLHTQALFESVKELFGWTCVAGVVLFVAILFFPIYKNANRKVFNWGKSGNTEEIASTVVG